MSRMVSTTQELAIGPELLEVERAPASVGSMTSDVLVPEILLVLYRLRHRAVMELGCGER